VKLRSIFILAALTPVLLSAPKVASGAPKPVMVHYMPWFQGPYSLGGTNWGAHWTGNGLIVYHGGGTNQFYYFDPNLTTNGKAEVASWYCPLIGPYDSLDPAVLEYHVLLMKLGGIDGVIVDWYGQDNYNDYLMNNQRTVAVFNYIRKAGLKFSLCYEDQTIAAEIQGNYITAANADSHAQQTMLYAQSNFFNDPCFLRLNNAPVLLNFGPQYFKTNSDWVTIFSALSASNQPAFFTEDNSLPVGQGAFDWPPMSLSGGGTNTLTPAELQGYLNTFETKAAGWPKYVSSGFPRFHDIYAKIGGTSYGYLDDANGLTLTNTLSRALTNNSSVVQIVTWNDYGEGTVIEPTVDYGFRDLGIIQNFRRQYLDATFPYHTNDAAMALQLYNFRKQYGSTAILSAEMDRIFTNIVSGKLSTANLQLSGLASTRRMIYNLSVQTNQLQFSIGGYLTSPLQVQISSDLVNWQNIQTIIPGTNLPVFTTNISQTASHFFRVQ